MAEHNGRARIAHQTKKRIRIELARSSPSDLKQLVDDLKLSPEIKSVRHRGNSLIIEHNEGEEVMTRIGARLSAIFPGLQQWSDEFDANMAKTAADPWVNKTIPLGFLTLAVYRGIRSGAFLAGESAFALAYLAFDVYWKFQQENVMRKIQVGLSKKEIGIE